MAHPSAEMYGSDRMAAEAASALVDAGHSVCVILPTEGPLTATLESRGARVRRLDVPVLRKANLRPRGLLTLFWHAARCLPTMLGVLREERPHVVYVNTVTQPWWLALARLQGLPIAVHVREAEERLPRVIATGLMAPLLLGHRVICNSQATARELHRVVPVLRSDRVRVVYNGKDWTRYETYDSPESRSERQTDFTMLVVGRLTPRKGQDVVIEALGELAQRGVGAKLRLAGDAYPGTEWFEEQLRRRAAELGVSDRVEFLGFVTDVAPELARTSVAIVPSRVESFGTVAAESMAAGVITIAAEVQGLTEIVTDRQTGLTFSSGDTAGLVDACLWVLHNPEAARRVGTAGRASIWQRFAPEQYRAQVVDEMEGLQHVATRRNRP